MYNIFVIALYSNNTLLLSTLTHYTYSKLTEELD